MEPKKVLTVAGSDCSGGAGMEADLKTFQERDVYGMCCVTVLVAMKPETWEHIVKPVDIETIKQQFFAILPGIGADAVKTGMLPTVEIIDTVGQLLKESGVQHIVIDPVMVCKGATQPLFPENTTAMKRSLLPIAEVITPNTFEASQLAGMGELTTMADLKEAAKRIYDCGPKAVVLKAARVFADRAVNLVYDGKDFVEFTKEKVQTTWTHGAGCSFSACVTAEIAKGASVMDAVKTATDFIYYGLKESFPLNRFVGPVYHKAFAKANLK